METKDLSEHVGEKYGRLKILEFSHTKKYTKTRHFYYKCLCDCGNETITTISGMKQGKSKSCGCYSKELRSLPEGEAALNKIFTTYKLNAKSRGYKFNLSKKEFVNIINKNCYYCNEIPKNSANTGYNTGNYIYNGVDRVNNDEDYNTNNCVPCCKVCNIAKHNMSQEDFLNWITRVYDNSVSCAD